MNGDELRIRLVERGIDWPGPIEWLGVTDSTNARLRERGPACPPWSVVWAASQTAGRGRRGNRWLSPPGNLYLSVLLPPPSELPSLVPLVAGLAAAEALEELGAAVRLKWPNDLLAAGRKLGGILAEASSSQGRLEAVVLGIGVNVSADPGGLSPELRGRTTSLREVVGAAPEPGALAAAILRRLLQRHRELLAGRAPELLFAWRERSVAWWGQTLEVTSGERRIRGTALGLDPDGALLLKQADGVVARLMAGEARELRPALGTPP